MLPFLITHHSEVHAGSSRQGDIQRVYISWTAKYLSKSVNRKMIEHVEIINNCLDTTTAYDTPNEMINNQSHPVKLNLLPTTFNFLGGFPNSLPNKFINLWV